MIKLILYRGQLDTYCLAVPDDIIKQMKQAYRETIRFHVYDIHDTFESNKIRIHGGFLWDCIHYGTILD